MTAGGHEAPDGFAEFVAARSGALLRSAWLLTGDAGKAEDLLQTVLAKAWPRWPTIAGGGAPEAYVRALRLLRADPDLRLPSPEGIGS